MKQPKLKITMYTFGMGSGHLARVNAVAKGFFRTSRNIEFSVIAPRTKYKHLLDRRIQVLDSVEQQAYSDIFICDWKADDRVRALNKSRASLWVGLKRMGRIPSNFPSHYLVVGIEPLVTADIRVWPIISTFRDELLTRLEFEEIVQTTERVTLVCENGAFASHPTKLFSKVAQNSSPNRVLTCSNSPYVSDSVGLNYWPIARIFPHAEKIVVGGGYNSIHECLSFCRNLEHFDAFFVGGDDQKRRLKHYRGWYEGHPKDSQARELALRLLTEIPGSITAALVPRPSKP